MMPSYSQSQHMPQLNTPPPPSIHHKVW
jgi:hypothetical protein